MRLRTGRGPGVDADNFARESHADLKVALYGGRMRPFI